MVYGVYKKYSLNGITQNMETYSLNAISKKRNLLQKKYSLNGIYKKTKPYSFHGNSKKNWNLLFKGYWVPGA